LFDSIQQATYFAEAEEITKNYLLVSNKDNCVRFSDDEADSDSKDELMKKAT